MLDARDPLACRCLDVERYIRSTSPNKRIILLLNKMGACRALLTDITNPRSVCVT